MKAVLGWALLISAVTGLKVNINYDSSCSQPQIVDLGPEFQHAFEAVDATVTYLTDHPFYARFFDESSRNDADFEDDVRSVYLAMGSMLLGNALPNEHYNKVDHTFRVTCNFQDIACTKNKFIAHMKPRTNELNVCESFFSHSRISKSQDVLDNQCNGLSVSEAHLTRSMILVHELTHTKFAMLHMLQEGEAARYTKDYAYQYSDCADLATGTFDRACSEKYRKKIKNPQKPGEMMDAPPLCPDPANPENEGICDKTFTKWNADSYALVAAGVYYSRKCGKNVALPQPNIPNPQAPNPVPTSSSSINGVLPFAEAEIEICKYNDDYLVIDDIDANEDDTIVPTRLTGYVHFGDSYASGMGTGDTSSDSCRVGSMNYGVLLKNWMNRTDITYEHHSCSGDTTDGVHAQISKWENRDTATVGTLTIGGNDLGFSDLVMNCVVNFWQSSTHEDDCTKASQSASRMLVDFGTDGLLLKLRAVYTRIIRNAVSPDFKLYVPGYAPFFNSDTTYCDNVRFDYWYFSPFNGIYQTQDSRVRLNSLVFGINQVINTAIREANQDIGSDRIFYVDMAKSWIHGKHRWCEEGVEELDGDREDTWFFLSGWEDIGGDKPNNPIGELSAQSEDDRTEKVMQEYVKLAKIPLPDASSCREDQAKRLKETGSLDPYEKYMCQAAIYFSDHPESKEKQNFQTANELLETGNFTTKDFEALEVDDKQPTLMVKTFHPRSSGMRAYRDAVIEAIERNGGLY